MRKSEDTQQQESFRVLLIGDTCVDIYHYGVCNRLSPEAPVPVFEETVQPEARPGMSANVRENLVALGIEVEHYTTKVPSEKHRYIDTRTNQQLIRIDKDNLASDEGLSNLDKINPDHYDALVISDYDKGYISGLAIEVVVDKFTRLNKPVFVDSKRKYLDCFAGCILKINENEINNAKRLPLNSKLITTMGSKGAMYNGKVFPCKSVDAFDVCGAGDVFLASLTKKYLETQSIPQSIKFANKMATISVTHTGTYVLSQSDIESK